MKILLTSDWYAPAVNGVVTSILNLRRGLEAQGHEVRVLTLSSDRHSSREGGVYRLGSLDAGRIYPGARLRTPADRQLLRELIAWKPDVVHSQCEFSTFRPAVSIARAVHAPLIHTYHTVYEDYTHYFSPSRRWGRRLVRGFTRHVLAQADAVFAPTEKVRELLLGYGVQAPVYVVPTGIDLRRFSAPADPAGIAARRAALGIPAQNRVLLYLGRLAKEKNLDALLECRARFGENVTLLLVGDGPERARLTRMAQELAPGGVVFAGMVPPAETADYYHLGAVFLSASSSETQGLTYIEALAAGLPAVCRADPCLSGVIESGVNGWQCRSAQELYARTAELLDNEPLRAAMACRAAEGAGRFSAQEFARSAARHYRAALWRKGGAVAPGVGELLGSGI